MVPAGEVKRDIFNYEKKSWIRNAKDYGKVLNKFKQGKQKLCKIETQDGIFECTENHKMSVFTSDNEYIWKETKNIKKGDRLMTSRVSIEGSATKLPSREYTMVMPELDPDMSWFLGLFQ